MNAESLLIDGITNECDKFTETADETLKDTSWNLEWGRKESKAVDWRQVWFLQGDNYSPIEFCLSEVPVCKLLQETKCYRMGQPAKREIKRTISLFIDDLKVYQESHKILNNVNETDVQTSHDIWTC